MSGNRHWLIQGGRVIDSSCGLDQVCDVRIRDGVIAQIGEHLAPEPDETLYPAAGLVCAPGLVDIHVHLRDSGIGDGGQPHKEDIFSGCRAAAAGGVTSLCCMPNTIPVCDQPSVVSAILRKAATASARVYPVAAVSMGLQGRQMTDFAALKQAGAVAVSDDGRPVLSEEMMERALRQAAQWGLRVLAHCEDLALAKDGMMHLGEVSRELGVPGIDPAAEDVATAREIRLAEKTGCPVHICHVSTAVSTDLIRQARKRGVPVTGETAPHYLLLTHGALRRRDADFRMNPPLRTEADRLALLEGVRDGTLSVIATDHAPHAPWEKADFLTAPNGCIGMETSLAACITALVSTGVLTLSQLIDKMSTTPARLLGLPAGTLAVGAAADLVLFDPEERWTVDPARLHGRSRNTPFKGMTLTGRVHMTLLGGRAVFQLKES